MAGGLVSDRRAAVEAPAVLAAGKCADAGDGGEAATGGPAMTADG